MTLAQLHGSCWSLNLSRSIVISSANRANREETMTLTAIAIENSAILPAHATQQGAMTVQVCGIGRAENPMRLVGPSRGWDCARVGGGEPMTTH